MPDSNGPLGAGSFADKNASDALRAGAGFLSNIETPQLDARVLLKAALNIDEAELIARANEMLSEAEASRYAEFLYRRFDHEPVAYITGVKEFWSLAFRVTPDVLIPRSDSECLIESAVERRPTQGAYRILDLGTGSGCLLLALLSEFTNGAGVGVDRSEAALSIAIQNAERLGLSNRTSFLAGDWLAPVEGVFDIIITNPPYIPDGDQQKLGRDVADYEPAGALFGGAEGLDSYRRILSKLVPYMAEEALLVMECGADQTKALAGMVHKAGLSGNETFTLFDLAGRPRGVGLDRRKA
jgi:release factor glutamine methyltransferase